MSICVSMVYLLTAIPAMTGSESAIALSTTAKAKLNEVLEVVLPNRNADVSMVELREYASGILGVRGQGWSAVLDNQSGELLDFSFHGVGRMELDATKELTHAAAIQVDQVFEIITPIVRFLSLDVEPTEFSVELVDMGEAGVMDESQKDLYLCEWWATYSYSLNEVPCRDVGGDRGVLICLSAFSGHISGIKNRPIMQPIDEAARVAETDALQLAEQWLATSEYFSGARKARVSVTDHEVVKLVVALPNTFPRIVATNAMIFAETQSYYCWEVPFEFEESGRRYHGAVWVRAHNGDIIGGQLRARENAD